MWALYLCARTYLLVTSGLLVARADQEECVYNGEWCNAPILLYLLVLACSERHLRWHMPPCVAYKRQLRRERLIEHVQDQEDALTPIRGVGARH